MVRIAGQQHANLDFKIRILKGFQTIASSGEGEIVEKITVEASLFTILEAGSYSLQIEFISEPHILHQPCQYIQLQMAMSTLAGLPDRPQLPLTGLTLPALLKSGMNYDSSLKQSQTSDASF